MKTRRLKLGDPLVVWIYDKRLQKYFKRFSILDQILLLADRYGGPLSKTEEKEFERLNRVGIMGMNCAEKRCKKLRKGGISWSPELEYRRHWN